MKILLLLNFRTRQAELENKAILLSEESIKIQKELVLERSTKQKTADFSEKEKELKRVVEELEKAKSSIVSLQRQLNEKDILEEKKMQKLLAGQKQREKESSEKISLLTEKLSVLEKESAKWKTTKESHDMKEEVARDLTIDKINELERILV